MENNSHNILSRLLKSLYAMDPLASHILMQNQRMASAQQQANRLPYLNPSVPVGTIGSQSYPLGLSKDMPPLPNVSSALKSRGIQPNASSPSMPMATFGSMAPPLGLSKDVEALPNGLSNLTSLQPQQALLPETPIPTVQAEPTQSVPLVQPQKDTAPQQSFWDQFRNPEFLQRLSDYAIGYASSDGTMAQSLANAAMNLRHGDLEREQKKQVNQTVEYLKAQGMSEEEARFMAGNKDALNAFLVQKISGGGNNPKFTNDGRMLVQDPNAPGGYRYVSIEGGKAYEDMQKREQMKKLQIVDAKIMRESTSQTINEALDILKNNPKSSTGPVGQFLQNLWNTPASRLKDHLEAIRGGAMLHRLDRIKALSPNGASGLGQLTEKEGMKLENVYAALQQSLSPQELIKNLKRLQEIYNKATDAQLAVLMNDNITAEDVDAAFGSGSQQPQGNVANLPIVKNAKEIEALPQGTEFYIRDANNTIMRIQK